MARVETTTEYIELEGDYGNPIDGVAVTCCRCGHTEESFGTSIDSIKRCAYLLRENCPRGEKNFYEIDE